MTYHGKEGISILERLVSAPESMPFSAEGSMRTAFTTRSGGWEGVVTGAATKLAAQDKHDYDDLDEKTKAKYNKKAILEIRPERAGRGRSDEVLDQDGPGQKSLRRRPLCAASSICAAHPLTDKYAIRNDKGEMEAVKIQSLFINRCCSAVTTSRTRQPGQRHPAE